MKSFAVRFSEEAERDLEAVFDHVEASLLSFGESPEDAFSTAIARVSAMKLNGQCLGLAPFQGTIRNDLLPGLRQVTKDKAIFYFTIDEANQCVNILAIFFGGQDHQRRMLIRVLGGE